MTWRHLTHDCPLPVVTCDDAHVGSIWECDTQGCGKWWCVESYETTQPYWPRYRHVSSRLEDGAGNPIPVQVNGRYVDRRAGSIV